MTPYFCPRCGWHVCRCEPDWRDLERARVASGVPIARPTWRCEHLAGDRDHGYNGIGLRRNGRGVAA